VTDTSQTASTKQPTQNLLFSIFIVVTALLVIEYSARAFITWRELRTEKSRVSQSLSTLNRHMQLDYELGEIFIGKNSFESSYPQKKTHYELFTLGEDSIAFRDPGADSSRWFNALFLGGEMGFGVGVKTKNVIDRVVEFQFDHISLTNLSVPGFTPAQYSYLTSRVLKQIDSVDAIVANFYSGNDIAFEEAFYHWHATAQKRRTLASHSHLQRKYQLRHTQAGSAKAQSTEQRPKEVSFFHRFGMQWFASYRIIHKAFGWLPQKKHQRSKKMEEKAAFILPEVIVIRDEKKRKITIDGKSINNSCFSTIAAENQDALLRQQTGYTFLRTSLLRLKTIADSLQVPLIITYTPTKAEAYASRVQKIISEKADTSVNLLYLHNKFIEDMRAEDVTVIDLLPLFQKHIEQQVLPYFQNSPYLNDQGHLLWAQGVGATLDSLSKVPPIRDNPTVHSTRDDLIIEPVDTIIGNNKSAIERSPQDTVVSGPAKSDTVQVPASQ